MKKTLVYLLLLLLLGAGVWYFLIRNDDNVFGNTEAGFTIRDTASIGKIFLAGTDGHSVTLERRDSGWVVNNTYLVMKAPMDQLLTTLNGQTAAYPAPKQVHNLVVEDLASGGIKVEVFSRDGQKIRTFFVGSEGPDFDGNYMLMEGAKRPYVVRLAGHMGYLKPRYSTDVLDWRDRHVFMEDPAKIRSIAIQYLDTPAASFELTQSNGKVNIRTTAPAGTPFNEKRALAYIGFFNNINCEGYVKNVPGIDSIIANTEKYCVIKVQGNKGDKLVEVYFMPVNNRSKNLVFEDGTSDFKYDPDHYYAVVNGGRDTMLIQQYAFERVFRKGYEFFQADATPAK